jgi:glycosyltransferase involved in cell wall biosynthesis
VKARSGFVVKGGFQTLTDEIARHFQTVNLCVPVANGNAENGQAYRENIEVTPFPPFQGRKALLSNLPEVLSVMWRVVREADIAYCMGPNDVGVMAMAISKLQGSKMFASIDTDRAYTVLQTDYNVLEKYARYGVSKYIIYSIIRFLINNVPVFVTGNMFMGNYKPWKQWIKTTLRSDEIPPKKVPDNISNAFHVVFAGRLSPEKNLQRLIRAIDHLSGSEKAIYCTIVGSGRLRNTLEKTAELLGAPIDFAGQIPNDELISSRFLGADLLALPSVEERQGKVLLEAMACSVPVVASRVGGIPTVLDHGVNGLLCDPHEEEDIASKIWRIMQDLDLRKKLIDNGYKYAKKHSLDIETKKLMDHVFSYYNINRK